MKEISKIFTVLVRPVVMFQILVCQINALMLEQCQEIAQTTVLVTSINSRKGYVLRKANFCLY